MAANIARKCPLIAQAPVNSHLIAALYCRQITITDIANYILLILRDLCANNILTIYDDYVAQRIAKCQSARGFVILTNLAHKEICRLYEILAPVSSLQEFAAIHNKYNKSVLYIGREYGSVQKIAYIIKFIKSLRPQIIDTGTGINIIFDPSWSS